MDNIEFWSWSINPDLALKPPSKNSKLSIIQFELPESSQLKLLKLPLSKSSISAPSWFPSQSFISYENKENYAIIRRMKHIPKCLRHPLWLLAIILFVWYLSFGYKYGFIYNHGVSMQPTIEDGEWIIMQKRSTMEKKWTPDRYDVVIINDVSAGDRLSKRIIGLSIQYFLDKPDAILKRFLLTSNVLLNFAFLNHDLGYSFIFPLK